MKRKSTWIWTVAAALLAAGLVVNVSTAAKKDKQGPKKAAVERTRKTVRMLDDIYKTAVVLITTHYVEGKDSLPAGTAAIALFDAVEKKGWHKATLLDVSGEPYDDKNVADDDFEKAAVKKFKAGEAYYDEIVTKDGKHYLRAATPIPVVMKKCITCHENYGKAKKGEVVGAIIYELPIE